MKKISILLMTTISLTACSFGNDNKVTLIDQEEDEEVVVIQNDLGNLVYDFEYEANDDEFTNLNIYIDQYVNGEKEGTVLSLTQNLADIEEDEGELAFFLNNIVPEHSERESIDFQLASIKMKIQSIHRLPVLMLQSIRNTLSPMALY